MSALGQKQTSGHVRVMSALPPKADIGTQRRDVRFVPIADIPRCSKERRYSGNSLVRPAHMLQIELQIEYRVGWTAKDGRYHVP